MGKLYICATPIGNLDDITVRTLNTLREVDLIAAEDTRRSIKLLNHYSIKTKMTSYHMHNENSKGEHIIDLLLEGKNIALISDAGMPGISDPGEILIKKAIKAGIDIEVQPGPTASLVALIQSGLASEKFTFQGFLPSKGSDRRKYLEDIKDEPYTQIIYESPYRIKDSLKDVIKVLGDRDVSLSRELTKKYEEILRGRASEVLENLEARDAVKGELVLIISAGDKKAEENEDLDIEKELEELILQGYKKSQAVKKVSQEYGIPRNLVYEISLKL